MKDYLRGIIGAIIGGIIGAIPWALLYIYGEMMLSLLAILIGLAAFYGYRLLKGPINNKVSVIICIISVVIVLCFTMVIVPIYVLYNEGYLVNWYNFSLFYTNNELLAPLLKDAAFGLLFTCLVIPSIVGIIKKEQNKTVGNDSDKKMNSIELKKKEPKESVFISSMDQKEK